LEATASVYVIDIYLHPDWSEVGCDPFRSISFLDQDGFNREGFRSVLREHRHHGVTDDFELGSVGGGELDEDVRGAQRNL
jgi:hypothetical protein